MKTIWDNFLTSVNEWVELIFTIVWGLLCAFTFSFVVIKIVKLLWSIA